MKMWVAKNFFFTSFLYIFKQTLIGLYIISFSQLSKLGSSLPLKQLNLIVLYPTVTSEDVC